MARLEYICPKCGHFNISARVMKERGASSPPLSPESPLSRSRNDYSAAQDPLPSLSSALSQSAGRDASPNVSISGSPGAETGTSGSAGKSGDEDVAEESSMRMEIDL
jgi:hypothetical protein